MMFSMAFKLLKSNHLPGINSKAITCRNKLSKFFCQFCFRYQSTLLGSYQTVELIETFMNYQVN